VFSVQAVVSLSSGWFLYRFQWEGLVFACLPLVFVFTLTLAFLRVPVRA
jgi:hypothetical protein